MSQPDQPEAPEAVLKDRVALVTGASRGIGAAAALAFARAGAHVVAVARNVEGLERLDDEITSGGGSATLVPLDLGDGDAIDRMAASLFERWGRLDVLLGNAAGLGALTPVAHIDPKTFERTVNLNFTANFRLIRAFDPLLRRSEAGRAIFVTSGATRSLPANWGLYSASKLAMEGLVLTYAREMENTSVRVNLINPGPTRTNMRVEAFPGEDPDSLPPADHMNAILLRLAAADFTGNGLWVAGDGSDTDALIH